MCDTAEVSAIRVELGSRALSTLANNTATHGFCLLGLLNGTIVP